MKNNARSLVRSTLSVGVGWLKAIVVSNGTNIPQLKTELNDIRNNLAQIEALRAKLRSERGEIKLFDFGPEIEDLRANCEAEIGLPAPIQPQWVHASEPAK